MTAVGHAWGAGARSPAWAAAVLVAHLLVIWLMAQALSPTARWLSQPSAAGVSWLQWWAPLAPAAPTKERAAPARSNLLSQPASPRAAGQALPQEETTHPPLSPVPPSKITPGEAPAITAPETGASAALRPPLDLNLRSARQRADAASRPPAAWARDDGRVNRPSSAEDRLARDLGSDPRWVEEDRGEVRRFRQGSSCVEVRAARDSQLNPWNQSTHQTPKQAKAC